jgi:tRNA1Val (adenine37-N6)-methyltransferase
MSEDYSQPDFYRFNQDSLELVKWIIQNVSEAESVLDLGAGSGVIGIELARSLKPRRLTLVEVQREYEVHLRKNMDTFVPADTHTNIVIESFSQFAPSIKYDLIVCNPPYYLPGRGEVSPDPARAIARSFIVDRWEILLKKVSEVMSEKGRCFFVLKKDEWLERYIVEKAESCSLRVRCCEYEKGIMILELIHS